MLHFILRCSIYENLKPQKIKLKVFFFIITLNYSFIILNVLHIRVTNSGLIQI